jgi:hypothetical protein
LALPGISAGQRLLIAGILLAILLLGVGKGCIRTTVARELFPEEASSLSRYGARYWQLRADAGIDSQIRRDGVVPGRQGLVRLEAQLPY